MPRSTSLSRGFIWANLCAVFMAVGVAQADQIDDVIAALRVPDTIEIMIEEGQSAAQDLASGDVDGAWQATLDTFYAPEAMRAEVEHALRAALEGDDLAGMLAYLSGPLGSTVIDAELSARRVLLDKEVSDAAMARVHDPEVRETARFALIEDWIDANDLIDRNVQGALNSNYAFFTGMAAEQGADAPVENDILTQLWNSEPELRCDIQEWSEGFSLLAYSALSDEEMRAHIAFAHTPAGQELIEANFAAYNQMFDRLSYDLGRALARHMSSEAL